MSSGKTHDKVNTLATIGISGIWLVTQIPELFLVSVGMAVGTIWLSPDLDLKQSNPSNRFGIFKVTLIPYRLLCVHHRSWVSHSPVISNLIRVVYFLAPLVLYSYVDNKIDLFNQIVVSRAFMFIIVGLEISTDIHLFLDWQYSLRRSWK